MRWEDVRARLSSFFLKPAVGTEQGPGRPPARSPRPPEELEAEARSANDKERLAGLILAPFAAAIGLLVIDHLVAVDPGVHHRNVGVYHALLLVLLALSVLMLATAWWRKRLYLGMVLALYGLAVFNLHYWGFGVPFLLAGAWFLYQAYRLQREVKEARGGLASSGGRPRAGNKRYTPPSTSARRSSAPVAAGSGPPPARRR